jgi:hypothetical protein
MRFRITQAVLLAAATLVFSPAARAQEINVRARVPFAFALGDNVYPAGKYTVHAASANTYFLSIKSEDGTAQVLIPSHLCISSKPASPANQAKLIFHRMGNTYFLYRIWVGGSTVGREFPRSRLETQMAMNGSRAETVVVAANFAR